ncbi:MAG: DNA polymerase III subunit delta' [Thermoanaerobacteraceae bacterium]
MIILYKIYGHEEVLNIFQRIIAEDRVANAYLFAGEKGTGKRFMAEYFAMMLNCRSAVEKPCFSCSSCVKMISKNHPDVFFIEADDSSIKVDTIREIVNNMLIKPYEKGKKIFIIDDAEKMTSAAQNALLKVLEETPFYGVFIIISSKKEELLSTIVSRCTTIFFNKEKDKNIKEFLISELNIEEDKAQILTHLADGNFDMAKKLTDEAYLELRDEIINFINANIGKQELNVIYKYDYFEKNKENIDDIIKIMISYFRDIYIFKQTNEFGLIKNIDKKHNIQEIAFKLTNLKLNNIISEIEEFNLNLMANVNYQLAIENLLLNIIGG